MKWPDFPTCHKNEPHVSGREQDSWLPRDTVVDRPFRSCSYCGSMHPEDLVNYLNAGAELESADWKYGWPHKFYINGIQNPKAGEIIKVGSHNRSGLTSFVMGQAPATVHAKWYSQHLADDGFDNEAQVVLQNSMMVSGIEFVVSDAGKVGYRIMPKIEKPDPSEPN